METELIYLGHDNSIDLILKSDNVAVDLQSVTKMTISFDTVTISSDNGDTDPIRWRKSNYATGEARLFLGNQNIPEGRYQAHMVVYDPVNIDGIVWGTVPIVVKEDVENIIVWSQSASSSPSTSPSPSPSASPST